MMLHDGAWGWCQMVLTAVVRGSTAWRRRCCAVGSAGNARLYPAGS